MSEDESRRTELLKILDIAEARRRYHHNALWEEQKHFAWWVSLIFPALVFVQSTASLTRETKLFLIFIASGFGVVVSAIALRAIRREGVEFGVTLEMVNRTAYLLGLDKPVGGVEGRNLSVAPLYEPKAEFDLDGSRANRPVGDLLMWPVRWLGDRLCLTSKPRALGVRDCFQLLFLVTILLFLLFTGWALWTDSGLALPLFV